MIKSLTTESSKSLPKLSLRISVTDKCQLRCTYCMPEEGISLCKHSDILSYEEIVRFIEKLKYTFEIEKVRITGGDPLIRKNIDQLIKMIATLEIYDIALTTNGQLLTEKAQILRTAGLQRVNISMDSLNPETFHTLTRGGDLNKTLSGLESAKECGLNPIKLNMVVLKGINDNEIEDMLRFAMKNNYRLRYLELMPIGTANQEFNDLYVSNDDVYKRLSKTYKLTPIPMKQGETSMNCKVETNDGQHSIVGFISPVSKPFCQGCARLRLSAAGYISGCLSKQDKVLVKDLISSEEKSDKKRFIDLVTEAIRNKKCNNQFQRNDNMASIGG